jgi:DNA uptake protein ComE-like DNA-binding protein
VPPTAAGPATKSGRSAPEPRTTSTTRAQSTLIDINTASEEELDALPGIGSARAEAIIKNRPYRGKDELVSKKVIPQNVYDGIKDKVVARQK